MPILGLQPGEPVLLFERVGANVTIRHALVLHLSHQPSLLGPQGEPSIAAFTVDGRSLRAGLSADWHLAIRRVLDVPHVMHDSWTDGTGALAYQTIPFPPSKGDQMEIAARATHEANRVLSALFGDTTRPPWADLSDHLRDSTLAGIRQIVFDPSTTPERSHEQWMEHKAAAGWVYGPAKNDATKTHPAMVPYAELGVVDTAKDALFGSVHPRRARSIALADRG